MKLQKATTPRKCHSFRVTMDEKIIPSFTVRGNEMFRGGKVSTWRLWSRLRALSPQPVCFPPCHRKHKADSPRRRAASLTASVPQGKQDSSGANCNTMVFLCVNTSRHRECTVKHSIKIENAPCIGPFP